ncbi:MAG TPA: ABC transporter [Verrucomicrobiales bacterium]|nr:ABC transporter [Verrucomicrobiales bacterium]
MGHYLTRRLAGLVPLLLVISLASFLLVRMAPGGPFDKERAPASPEIRRAIEAKYHLDEPRWRQYLRYLGVLPEPDGRGGWRLCDGGVLKGDLGPSFKYRNHTVNDVLAQGLPVSMTLGGLAFLFALGTGIPLGLYTAARRGEWADHLGGFVAILAFCIPGLVVGPVLVMLFAVELHWLPAALWESPAHAILPTIALGLYFAGRISRLMREGMTEVMREGFMTTAKAKGLGERSVLLRHGLRLAILPVVSYCGPLLADLLTGSFVVESIFRIPGIGVFLVNAALSNDYPMLVGLTLVYACLLVVLNLLVDVVYSLLDPRVKFA